MALSPEAATRSGREYAGLVKHVLPGSIAEEVGILPGYRLVRINGLVPEDLIDFRFAEAAEDVALHFLDEQGDEVAFEVEKETEEYLGISFESPVFDGIHECHNRCPFCFVDQLPEGMRSTLYVRDDDYRLSFLYGNFATLTNLDQRALQRIFDLKLSPLYVSVHATDPAARRQLLRNKKHADVLPRLRELIDHDIQLHTQVVVNPGINDGAVLAQTISDLARLYPGVLSLGVVPVGLTGHRSDLPALNCVSPELATALIAEIDTWQQRFEDEISTRFVFCSDEMYAIAGIDIPAAEYYEEFPQLENGVGCARLFLDELEELEGLESLPEVSSSGPRLRCTLVTAEGPAKYVHRLAAALRARLPVDPQVVVVQNRWFGGNVDVAGLLTGRDISEQVRGRDLGEIVFVPAVCLKDDYVFLDDTTIADLAATSGVPVSGAHGLPLSLVAELRQQTRRRKRITSAAR